jgi:hypothetical protein
MLVSDLILSVLPRVGNIDKPNGISIYRAATAIQSLIAKRLLDRKSDLLATGSLSVQIAAFGYYATLPADFLSLSQRPYSEELFNNWMAGTVTSYDTETGALVFNSTASSGTDTLDEWVISSAGVPGEYAKNIATSATSNVVGSGAKSFTIETGLYITAGQYLIISAENSPDGWEGAREKLEPSYLNADDDKDVLWWETYELNQYDNGTPSRYQVIGDTIYIRPKPIVDVLVKGVYNQLPAALTLPTQTIPWKGKFDEIFIEGSIMIIAQGIAVPETNQAFMVLFDREFDTVINSRAALLPKTKRLRYSDFM